MLYKYVKREVILPSQRKVKPKRDYFSFAVSTMCFLAGVGLLFYSVYPYIKSPFKTEAKGTYKSLLSPSMVREDGIQKEDSQTAALADYNSNVNKNFSKTNEILNINPKTHPEYSAVQGEMYITIPKLNINSLPIKINVNSFNEAAYMPLLEKTLAHFQGTSIPGKPGNTFVYGHSANELLAKSNPGNPKYAFSFLGNLDIGDDISVRFNNKEYKYSMYKLKMVTSDNITPIYSTSEDQHLTLMTCWPPGIGTERLIVMANMVEEKSI
jgi:sortase A